MIAFGFLLVALLYAAVGHGGASGYLALMAFTGFSPAEMKPTALVLNLAVSLIGTVMFFRAGHFAWRLFWPFALVAVPFAYLGGGLHVDAKTFRLLIALTLVFATVRLLLPVRGGAPLRLPPWWAVVLSGAAMGFLSGLIGVGGGIFLTPLLLLCRWADTKTAAAVSAPFIFVNSAAGLLGHVESLHHIPSGWPWWLVAVLAGGFVGARWGSRVAQPARLRPVLAAVLVLATVKLLIT